MTSPEPNRPEVIWGSVLDELRHYMDSADFEYLFRDTQGLRYDGQQFIVGVSNAVVGAMLEERASGLIQQTLDRVTGVEVDIHFQPQDTRSDVLPTQNELETTQYERLRSAGLNPRYTFDGYLEGPGNRMAYAAARAVVDNPGLDHNPLVVHSPVGLGKTHLLQAIGNALLRRGYDVRYSTAEGFTNDYISALRRRRGMDDFRALYREPQVLLLDDVQVFIGAESTQDEFFHTFNDLYMTDRQIVLALDRRPSALTGLLDRVQSRIASGRIVRIDPPDLETRVAFLRNIQAERGIRIASGALYAIAETALNFRALRANLLEAVPSQTTEDAEITTEEILGRVLGNTIGDPGTGPTPTDVIAAVASATGVSPEAIIGKHRSRRVVGARHLAMYLLHSQSGISLRAIATALGRTTPSAVTYGLKAMEKRLQDDPESVQLVDTLEDELFGRQRLTTE